jgi:uncharacterized protein YecE (DUF72 family)
LHQILRQLDPTHRNVVEFRHPSWWTDEVYGAFKETGADIYVRFHGVQRCTGTIIAMTNRPFWANRIREAGADRVWVYFNNDFDGYASRTPKCVRNPICRLTVGPARTGRRRP